MNELIVPPRWLHEPKDTALMLGNAISINCLAEGYPEPEITWFKGGKQHGLMFIYSIIIFARIHYVRQKPKAIWQPNDLISNPNLFSPFILFLSARAFIRCRLAFNYGTQRAKHQKNSNRFRCGTPRSRSISPPMPMKVITCAKRTMASGPDSKRFYMSTWMVWPRARRT